MNELREHDKVLLIRILLFLGMYRYITYQKFSNVTDKDNRNILYKYFTIKVVVLWILVAGFLIASISFGFILAGQENYMLFELGLKYLQIGLVVMLFAGVIGLVTLPRIYSEMLDSSDEKLRAVVNSFNLIKNENS